MRKGRRIKLKHFVQDDVLGRGGQPLLPSDHVSYTHQIIIYHIRKVVRWESVAFQNHLVIHRIVVEDDLSMDKVFELGLASRHKHTDNVWLSTVHSFLNFLWA